jgi:hypothetical protein
LFPNAAQCTQKKTHILQFLRVSKTTHAVRLIYLQAEVKGDRWHAGGKERGRQHTYPDRSWFVLRSIHEQAGEVGGDAWAVAENVGL